MEFLPYISLVFALGVLWRQEVLIRRNRRERAQALKDLYASRPRSACTCAEHLNK